MSSHWAEWCPTYRPGIGIIVEWSQNCSTSQTLASLYNVIDHLDYFWMHSLYIPDIQNLLGHSKSQTVKVVGSGAVVSPENILSSFFGQGTRSALRKFAVNHIHSKGVITEHAQ